MTLFKDIKIESPSLHLISGMPGGGKTAAGFTIANRIHLKTNKELFVSVSPDQAGLPKNLPKWIHEYHGLDYPLDSIVLLDDAQLQAHARKAMTSFNVEFDKLHSTLRHDNIDYILDSQSLKTVDVSNVLRSNYRWYKKPYQLDVKLGRPEIKTELETAQVMNLGKSEAYLVAETYGYSFNGKVTEMPLPTYWTNELSTMHRRTPSTIVQLKRTLRIY